eukprot:CAMPEP_0181393860 /NCGR_PEP_ID=MMETSP1106-20121128/27418_1 /TAXON_ID=81844 /ORGANISM="Mantoniella antarctica, Strain SL-175" /LENGTH=121 /DNA_ID=CAMNT_0023515215 /DNA_START=66 /DNA_END=427 /DNA_ORIENTATION=+
MTEKWKVATATAAATAAVPAECPTSVAVDCGGAKGEFVVCEGLVHCACRGCAEAVTAGFQPTNVFGLQAFEFHGGKGSAGKWKASIKVFPDGYPPEETEAEAAAAIAEDEAEAAAAAAAAA